MKIIFGLGNQGKEFTGTRHNLGAVVLRAWAEQATEEELVLAKLVYPLGLMNNSGTDFIREIKISQAGGDDLLLVHDDMELSLGESKLGVGGSAKGHNGVRSVLAVWEGTEISRLRLGIGRPPEGVTAKDFVLARFKADEKEGIAAMTEAAILLIDQFLFGVSTENN